MIPSSSLPEKTSISVDNLSIKLPVVSLDADAVSDAVAAKLATSLLGQVLFLKSQIPLPIIQLGRISLSSKSSAKATKCRTDLLTAFDTLASHLSTTFTALSTALELLKRSSPKPGCLHPPSTRTKAYLAIVIGSSIPSSKWKVFFAVDGFETKVWGEDAYVRRRGRVTEAVSDGEVKLDKKLPRNAGEDIHEGSDVDGESQNEKDTDEKEEGIEEYECVGQDSECDDLPSVPSPSPSPSPSRPPSRSSYAEQQETFQAADRLLARALARADAEGHGLSCEIAPTQTQILIRAPRRFDHPAWIPRQNLTRSMETSLVLFQQQSGACGVGKLETSSRGETARKDKVGVQGVWITDRQGLMPLLGDYVSNEDVAEMDEIIWWSWEGRLSGFSDW